MYTKFERNDHIFFPKLKNALRYNAVIINDIFIKNKGYFYEVIYQEIIKNKKIKITEREIMENIRFKRDWYLYKDMEHTILSMPFIKRSKKWINFSDKVKYTPYLIKEINDIEKEYKINIIRNS